MTSKNEAKEAMYLQFQTAWNTTGFPSTFENDEFTPPDNSPWARLSVRHTASTQDTLGKVGNRKFARLGSTFIQIYTEPNTGTKQSDALVKLIKDAFEGVSLAGTTVRFNDVIDRETGSDGKWYQVVVEAMFEYDETK